MTNNHPETEFKYLLEQFADIKIMRYRVPGFEELTLSQKKLLYFLSQAALCGRDILSDQFYRHNLLVRRTIDVLVENYPGNRDSETFLQFMVYAKRVWFSNGIHHHYSTEKFFPEMSKEAFGSLIAETDTNCFPLQKGESISGFTEKILSIIYDDTKDLKRVCFDGDKDLITASATNFYAGLTQTEVEAYNAKFVQPDGDRPLSQGLNSRLVKKEGQIQEEIYKVGGKYSKAIESIVFWLNNAREVAENYQQKKVIELLIDYYQSGDLKKWDEYSTAWVDDHQSHIDFINGFIEVYGDPLGMKGTWEAMVNFKDSVATHRAEIISKNAQWFEDHAPIEKRFKKEKVKGVTAKVITAVQLGGDCYPSTPIGINLPNADWIRKEHGSKSVTIENITYAYHQASLGNGFLEEFCFNEAERKLAEEFGYQASNLHTDLHECLGHGSGQLLPGVSGEALKNYSSVLEEARADLFALYYIADDKMVELGLLPNAEAYKAEYNTFIRNGLLTQLTRIELGKNIEEAHMRNRQLIARWCLEQGADERVLELVVKEGKTYAIIHNYEQLRALFGKLLSEIQRIKSEGDFEAGKRLVETYAVKIDRALHEEILTRYKKLKLAPYGGFVNPNLVPIYIDNQITDVLIDYTESYEDQMTRYGKEFGFLELLTTG